MQLQIELDCAEAEHDAFEESYVHGTENNCEQEEDKRAKSPKEMKSVVNAEGAILPESSAANVHPSTEPGPSDAQSSSKFQLSRAANVEAVTSMPTFSHLRSDEPLQAKPNHRATFNVSTFPFCQEAANFVPTCEIVKEPGFECARSCGSLSFSARTS